MSTTKRSIGRCVIPVLAVLAFQLLTAGMAPADSTGSKPHRKSVGRSATSVKTGVKTLAPTSKITISLSHRIRRGNLVVSLDGDPIFNEPFERAALALFQTTTWDPFEAPAGKHRLTAQVKGKNGKTYRSETYELQLTQTKAIELRIRMKRDKLTIESLS